MAATPVGKAVEDVLAVVTRAEAILASGPPSEDALVDDTVLMFEKWRAAGNDATLDVWPEGPHGVGHFGVHATTKLGMACRAKVHERIGAFLDAYRDA